ncbi:chymotrypsinogen A-like [Saccoglossus kowalevskii]|uniref:Chymotrypsinogen A-like n=1 Tax=Saccoglossus kowalevskii TaxID=10224 RepID=A0ABM0GT79_SACKO|nr:PREDICTED: chymotrypsinogen A-like [Saccoglossus kowalevskii]
MRRKHCKLDWKLFGKDIVLAIKSLSFTIIESTYPTGSYAVSPVTVTIDIMSLSLVCIWIFVLGISASPPRIAYVRDLLREFEPISNGTTNIVGGTIVEPHSNPWQVLLYFKEGNAWYICGGILVDPLFVLTAAHCGGAKPRNYEVWLGEHDRSSSDDGILYSVESVTVSENYNKNSLDSDYALLKLKTAADITNTKIATIPLGTRKILSGEQCVITGWGTTSSGSTSRYLQGTAVSALNNTECSAKWSGVTVTDNMLCAGNGPQGVCPGDSGGPLICQTDGAWEVHGITSWGHRDCGTSGFPDVYTRISINYADISGIISGTGTVSGDGTGNVGRGRGNKP